ncbi:MAG TPA: hypothetical protein VGC96_00550, partial [Candidatus Elarobacter sp.]
MASSRRAAAAAVRHALGPLDEARSAWNAGEYARVVRLLSGAVFERRDERVAAAHWQARALLALDRPEEAAPLLQRVSKHAQGAAETAAGTMLLGASLARTNRREQGEALLDQAASLVPRSAPQLAAEVAYYRA